MYCFGILISFSSIIFVKSFYDNEITLKCIGQVYYNVSLTAYYPDYSSIEHGYRDKNGTKLKTLQDYIDGRSEFVTLSMDDSLNIPYGTRVCNPELNMHYGHRIRLEVRDSSYDVEGSGYKRAEICVRSEVDSYDLHVNRMVTLVFL